MSLFSKLKEGVKSMVGIKDIEKQLDVSVAMSTAMQNGIATWSAMYQNKSPWLHEPDEKDNVRIVSLGIPAMIASEKARTALLEFQSEITAPTKEVEEPNPDFKDPPDMETNVWGQEIPKIVPKTITTEKPVGSEVRAEFLNTQYKNLKDNHLRKQLEYGIALGGLVIKPYPIQVTDPDTKEVIYKFQFDFVRANCFFPLSFDNNDNITECVFVQQKINKNETYYRTEYHKWENSRVTIINKAFKSTNLQSSTGEILKTGTLNLGKPIKLSEVPEWASLQEKTVVGPVAKPLFAYFKMPEANTLDFTSPLGVSGYSRALQLIKDADMQYSRLLWEYEAGEMAVNVDRDAFRWMQDADGSDRGHSQLGKSQQRMYRQLDVGEGELFEPYAPTLRDASYQAGLNSILMRIEDVTGISRGTLSDASVEAKTATEIKVLKQRSYQTNLDIQKALQKTLEDVVYIMNVYCDLYNITETGEYDISFEWDDSILVDVEQELNHQITLLQNGLTDKVHVRMWYYGETERQAKEALEAINEESKKDAENDLANQDAFGEEDDK